LTLPKDRPESQGGNSFASGVARTAMWSWQSNPHSVPSGAIRQPTMKYRVPVVYQVPFITQLRSNWMIRPSPM